MAIIALGLVRDLFFRSKLDAVAASLGAEILYASDLANASRRAAEKKPSVVFADLSDASFPAADTASKIREAAPDAKLIGFASHIDLKPLARGARGRIRSDPVAQRIHRAPRGVSAKSLARIVQGRDFMTLANKTVVVLGGSSGIGLATAKAAKAEGANVVITGRSQQRLDAARAEIGSRGSSDRARCCRRSGHARAVRRFAEARSYFRQRRDRNSRWRTGARTPKSCALGWIRGFGARSIAAKYGAPKMPRDGSITFCSGTSAWRPIAGSGGVGAASCGAVEALARSLAVDLAPIRVNAVAPGLIDTPLIADVMGANAAAIMEREAKRLPVGRVGPRGGHRGSGSVPDEKRLHHRHHTDRRWWPHPRLADSIKSMSPARCRRKPRSRRSANFRTCSRSRAATPAAG